MELIVGRDDGNQMSMRARRDELEIGRRHLSQHRVVAVFGRVERLFDHARQCDELAVLWQIGRARRRRWRRSTRRPVADGSWTSSATSSGCMADSIFATDRWGDAVEAARRGGPPRPRSGARRSHSVARGNSAGRSPSAIAGGTRR